MSSLVSSLLPQRENRQHEADEVVQAPTPNNEVVDEPGQIGLSTNTSPGGSVTNYETTGESVEREKTESVRNASLHRKMLETHLHVPSIRHVSGSRTGSVRRMGAGSTSTPGTLTRTATRLLVID